MSSLSCPAVDPCSSLLVFQLVVIDELDIAGDLGTLLATILHVNWCFFSTNVQSSLSNRYMWSFMLSALLMGMENSSM